MFEDTLTPGIWDFSAYYSLSCKINDYYCHKSTLSVCDLPSRCTPVTSNCVMCCAVKPRRGSHRGSANKRQRELFPPYLDCRMAVCDVTFGRGCAYDTRRGRAITKDHNILSPLLSIVSSTSVIRSPYHRLSQPVRRGHEDYKFKTM